MLDALPAHLLGAFSLAVLACNTLFWCSLLFVAAPVKILIPAAGWRTACTRLCNSIARNWVGFNSWALDHTKNIRWDVEGIDALKPDAWYLLVANHQSMVDIVVLQRTFHRRIPLLKFFLKRELIWVPLLGPAWWALDFPFMKRSSSTRKDLETARDACEKFRQLPVTIMNFVEGTRFTPSKKDRQKSPFTHLLKPKVGGIGIVLSNMGERLESILDVTIVYPGGTPGFWAFLCGRSMEIKVRVRQLPVNGNLVGDFMNDPHYRRRVANWLNDLWKEKDETMEELLRRHSENSSS